MESHGIKTNKNVYFNCRKEAAICNPNLQSREKAAELIGISSSTLADYELGVTKIIPPENVVIMADLYRCPELKKMYCMNCPIGKDKPLATEVASIEGVALRLLRNFDMEVITQIEKDLISIASDGVIDEAEMPTLEVIVNMLDKISFAIDELKLVSEKLKG